MKKYKTILIISLFVILMSVFGNVMAQDAARPAIKVSSVETDVKVVLITKDFPAATSYIVYMASSEAPEDFTAVAKFNSNSGGKLSITVKIPAKFHGEKTIELKLEDEHGGVIPGSFVNIPEETVEEPVIEEPAAEEPAKEEPEKEEPAAEEPVNEEPAAEEPAKEEPEAEDTTKIELVNEETIKEEPAGEKQAEETMPENNDPLVCDFSVIPYVTITGVVRNESVTFVTTNFPADSTFSVSMGTYVSTWVPVREPVYGKPHHHEPVEVLYPHEPVTIGDEVFYVLEPINPDAPDFHKPGDDKHKPGDHRITGYVTSAFNGTQVGTFETGSGAPQTLTFAIPAEMRNVNPIAIWISDMGPCGFYSYNYFYNNSTN